MKKNIYVIKDCVLGQFTNLFLAPNDGIAERQMKNAVNDTNINELTNNTADFQLFRIGTINFENGEIENKVEFMKHLIELKERKNEVQNSVQQPNKSTY